MRSTPGLPIAVIRGRDGKGWEYGGKGGGLGKRVRKDGKGRRG